MNNIRDISPLTSCKELVDLNLSFIPTLYDFSPLYEPSNFPMLERLWVAGSHLSTANFNLLRAKYPKATVCRTGPGSTAAGWRSHERYFAMINMYYKRNYMSELFSKYDR